MKLQSTHTASCFAQVLFQGGQDPPVCLHSDLHVLGSGDLWEYKGQGGPNLNCLSLVPKDGASEWGRKIDDTYMRDISQGRSCTNRYAVPKISVSQS